MEDPLEREKHDGWEKFVSSYLLARKWRAFWERRSPSLFDWNVRRGGGTTGRCPPCSQSNDDGRPVVETRRKAFWSTALSKRREFFMAIFEESSLTVKFDFTSKSKNVRVDIADDIRSKWSTKDSGGWNKTTSGKENDLDFPRFSLSSPSRTKNDRIRTQRGTSFRWTKTIFRKKIFICWVLMNVDLLLNLFSSDYQAIGASMRALINCFIIENARQSVCAKNIANQFTFLVCVLYLLQSNHFWQRKTFRKVSRMSRWWRNIQTFQSVDIDMCRITVEVVCQSSEWFVFNAQLGQPK